MYADVINVKKNIDFVPKCIPRQLLLEPRNMKINAFIFEKDSLNLHREIYYGSIWKKMPSMKLPFSPYAIVQAHSNWIVFTENRQVLLIDRSSLAITTTSNVPNDLGDKYCTVACCCSTCIYAIGTFTKNSFDYLSIFK